MKRFPSQFPPARLEQRLRRRARGFTLLELLVVLAIMGILAAIGLPAIKGLRKSNVMASATQQMLSDFALARQTAIRERTTVHVLFVTTNVFDMLSQPPTDFRDRKTITNLLTHSFTTYALFAERTVGDQPGQPHYRYLGPWRTLPEGVIIDLDEFIPVTTTAAWNNTDPSARPFHTMSFPFPTASGVSNSVPHIAFDSRGALVNYSANSVFQQDEYINFGQGAVLVQRDPSGRVLEFDVRPSPVGNTTNQYIRIDGVTGRARVERPPDQEIQ